MNRVQTWYSTQPKALRALLTINVAVYLVWILIGQFVPAIGGFMANHLALNPGIPGVLYEPWQVLTYNFLHVGIGLGGFLHVLFNMLWLVWIGREYEEMHGAAHLMAVYLITGVGGGVLSVLLANTIGGGFFPPNVPIHGASGAVLGLMAVVATKYPYKSIALFLLGPVRLVWIVVGFLVLDVLLFSGTAIGAHMGGALAGFLMAKGMQRGMDLTSWANVLVRARSPKRGPAKTASRGPARRAATAEPEGSLLARLDGWLARRTGRAETAERAAPPTMRTAPPPVTSRRRPSPNVIPPDSEAEIDRILDKISAEGLGSLTREERRTLDEASQT